MRDFVDRCVKPVARELERAGKPAESLGTGTYVLADGSKVRKRRVLLRDVTVGGQTVSNVTASISAPGSPQRVSGQHRKQCISLVM